MGLNLGADDLCLLYSSVLREWIVLTFVAVACVGGGVKAAETTVSSPAAASPRESGAVLRTLTLSQAKQMSFERNWDLLAAKSDVDLATAQRIIAHEFPNPTLSLSSEKIGVDRGSGTPLGNSFWDRSYDSIAAVNQLFEIGGKRSSRQRSARAGFEAAEARFEDAHRVLDLAVTKAYIAALLAESNRQILQQSSASLRQEARIAETRLRAGDISVADKSQIEIAADRLELDSAAAAANAAAARIAVEVLLGEKDPQGNWAPGDSLEVLASLPFTHLQGSPGASRPDLRAAEATERKAEAELRLQKAMRIPDPTVMVMYEHEPPDVPNSIGLGVSFPLPLWNRNRGAIKAASASKDAAALQVEKLKAQIAAEVNTASLTYADAAARLRRQRDEIQPKSATVKQTVSFAYEKGGASLVDLLTAERNDNEIRLATAQAMADAANAAAASEGRIEQHRNFHQPTCSNAMNSNVLLSLLPVCLLLAGCHHPDEAPAATAAVKAEANQVLLPEGTPQSASVTTEVVQHCPAPVTRLNGRLVWDDDVTVRVFTPFAGRVTSLQTEVGQKVKKGDCLARIASPDYGAAQADARKAATDFVLADRNLNRLRELFEHGAAAQKDLQSAEADFHRAQAEKQRAEAKLAMYGGNADSMDQVYELRSPQDGVVVERNINPGQEVRADAMLANAPQFFAPLFVVTDPTRLWVQVDATEQDLPQLQRGQELLIRTRAYTNRVFAGKVDFISDFLDSATRTIKVRGSLQNPERLLKAEMFVNVELAAKPEQVAGLDVSAKAVYFKGDKHYVFVDAGSGRYNRREVKVGPEHEGKILVLDGLEAGQRVVTEGCLLLDQMLQASAGS